MTIPTRFAALVYAAAFATAFALADMTPAAAQSAHYCDSKARAYADRRVRGSGVVGGAIGGAVTGAIIGGIIDGGKGAGRGAAIGGGVGAVGGAINEGHAWQAAYDRAYHRCMTAAHRPARATAGHRRPRPWTDAWFDYCAAKYRSFDPETGRYRTYSGKYRMCR